MRRLGSILALVASIVAALGGCGGDSETVAEEPLFPEVKGPSREFLVRDGDNAVQTFGREATKLEREEASDVIEAWLRAREAGRWSQECRYFARKTQIYLIESGTLLSQKKVRTCAKGVEIVSTQDFSPSRVNNLSGPIDSLRLEEGRGYAQYHGNDGKDWVVPVMREDGAWKITRAEPLDRFK